MSNRIHPTAVVGAGVELGDRNVIGPFSVVIGPCRIGDDNWIGPHVTIGTPAEHRDGPHPVGWDDELAGAGVWVGDRNRIREYVTVHQGTEHETRIGDDCYLLSRSHAGHDVRVDDDVTLACSVQLGGHSRVWSHATLGLGALVHQRCAIGPGAMVGMGAAVRGEVAPFTVSVGSPARTVAMNEVGLRRLGCPVVTGPAELSDVDLPDDVAALLKLWKDREKV
ncbi:MAG TPA: UDP-N-acetylglucosamine acyltransferase [Pseudonocardiaceae bacterium]|nr:UDP-N-acetylglucosamine acyltransferase [Pseudonocardiaceae bacterium]